MPARSKGLTWSFNLRLDAAEERAVRLLVEQYAECGIKISLNDAVRYLIRWGGRGVPRNDDGVHDLIREHVAECEPCRTAAEPGCPEGKRLRALLLLARQWRANGPATPPPAVDGSVAPPRPPAPALMPFGMMPPGGA